MEYISMFQTELWIHLSDLITSAMFIAVYSSLLTEAIKVSCKNVFTKISPKPLTYWIINTVIIEVSSILFVIVFKQGTILELICYNLFIAFIAWAISVLLYILIIRIFMTLCKTLYIRTKLSHVRYRTELTSAFIHEQSLKQEYMSNESVKGE